jgi:RNA polymerase sigma-70 factor (ECF subfamily)
MDDFANLPGRELGRRSDEELVAYIRAVRERGATSAASGAFDHLVFRHRKRLHWLLARMLPAERVDELLQDVFLDAFQGVIGDKPIDNFQAWVNQVARNTIADFWRGKEGVQIKRDREAAPADDDDDGRSARRQDPSVDGDFGSFETMDLIGSLLAKLSDTHRTIVVLAVLQQRPAAEVRSATGESDSNIYKVAQRFRDNLRRRLRGDHSEDGI